MSCYHIRKCDVCGRETTQDALDRSGQTTGEVSFWLHNERKGYANTHGTHYRDICSDCTTEILAVVDRLRNPCNSSPEVEP